MENRPDLPVIRAAHQRIAPHIHRTPVMTSGAIDESLGCRVFFKCENFQKTGSFKARGATNAVFSLSDDDAFKGVVTHSSGNFAAALSLAAKRRGIPAYVVMPDNSPDIKKQAVKGYGGIITFCKPTLEAREQGVKELIERTGATFLHPYNDHRTIAGQGTAALELHDQVESLDVVIAPVGGGGLMSGTALATAAVAKDALLIGAEPKVADDAARSLAAGKIIPSDNPDTISDGLRTSLGDLTFPILLSHLKDIVTVTEEETASAMRMIWERMKIIVEPSAAVTLAAISKTKDSVQGKRIGAILSGGNVDLNRLPW